MYASKLRSIIFQKPNVGFALIVSVILVSFIFLISTSFLLTFQEQTRVLKSNRNQLLSQKFADFTLALAIGRLQSLAGRDQSITAPASILDGSGYSGVTANRNRQRLVGVWDNTNYNISLPSEKTFLGWLHSGTSKEISNLNSITDATAAPESNDDWIWLDKSYIDIDAKTFDREKSVSLPLQTIKNENNEPISKYAFWIDDHSLGLTANLSSAFYLENEISLGRTNFISTQVGNLSRFFDSQSIVNPLFWMDSIIDNLNMQALRLGQKSLSKEFKRQEQFVNFYNQGLFVNHLTGTLKTDLTTIILNNDPITGNIHNTSYTDIDFAWTDAPQWSRLNSYLDLANQVGNTFTSRPHSNSQFGYGPVLTHVMFNFFPKINQNALGEHRLRIYIEPIIILWNPYNVTLSADSYFFDYALRRTLSEINCTFTNPLVNSTTKTYTFNKNNTGNTTTNINWDSFTSIDHGLNDDRGFTFKVDTPDFGPGDVRVFTLKELDNNKDYQSIGINNFLEMTNDAPENFMGSQKNFDTYQKTFYFEFSEPLNASLPTPETTYRFTLLSKSNSGFQGIKLAGLRSVTTNKGFLSEYFTAARCESQVFNTSRTQEVYLLPLDIVNTSVTPPTLNNQSNFCDIRLQLHTFMYSSDENGDGLFKQPRWLENFSPTAPNHFPDEVTGVNRLWYNSALRQPNPANLRYFEDNWGPGLQFAKSRPEYKAGNKSNYNLVLKELPRSVGNLVSLAQLQHFGPSSNAHFNSNPIGNSLIEPRLLNFNTVTRLDKNIVDYSYILNRSLWDDFFFSTYDSNTKKFANQRVTGNPQETFNKESIAKDIFCSGAFNINSTNPDLWYAYLSGIKDLQFDPVTGDTNNTYANTISRLAYPTDYPNSSNPWNGIFRELSDQELSRLCNEIVKQIKLRGPFKSLSEFVNRGLSINSAISTRGPLAQAIEDAGINSNASLGFEDRIASTDIENAYLNGAATGSRNAGATAWINQADLLTRLGSSIQPRGDTFTIRTGSQFNDRIIYLEAVVQRTYDPITPLSVDKNNLAYYSYGNNKWGRSFKIISVRQVLEDEI